MVAIKCHFDGKVFVPDEPVEFPRDRKLIVHIEPDESSSPTNESNAPINPVIGSGEVDALEWIVSHSVNDPSLPADLSHNLHHYLYGTTKLDPPLDP